MSEENLRELNQIRNYLEISENEFKILLLMAIKYQIKNQKSINEELLCEIIKEALSNMDYLSDDLFDDMPKSKTIEECFNRALMSFGYQKNKR